MHICHVCWCYFAYLLLLYIVQYYIIIRLLCIMYVLRFYIHAYILAYMHTYTQTDTHTRKPPSHLPHIPIVQSYFIQNKCIKYDTVYPLQPSPSSPRKREKGNTATTTNITTNNNSKRTKQRKLFPFLRRLIYESRQSQRSWDHREYLLPVRHKQQERPIWNQLLTCRCYTWAVIVSDSDYSKAPHKFLAI